MELREKVETINRQLVEEFGVDTVSGQPMWRLVFSDDVLEKRLMTHTDSGIELLFPEMREVKKYHDVRQRYVLERLIGLDPINANEHGGDPLYYNPIWVFKDLNGNYLPPFFEGCRFLAYGVYQKEGKVNIGKVYLDPELDPQTKADRINKIVEELFGEHPEYTEKMHNTVIGFHPKG